MVVVLFRPEGSVEGDCHGKGEAGGEGERVGIVGYGEDAVGGVVEFEGEGGGGQVADRQGVGVGLGD